LHDALLAEGLLEQFKPVTARRAAKHAVTI
jgi:hypothetical protein